MDLNQLLKEKGMTQYKLSKAAGLGRATISEIFSKKRKEVRLETAIKIAKVLGIDATDVNEYVRSDENAG